MFLKIYPENPSSRQIKTVVECLSDGGVIIFPTDTIYGLGCDIYKPKSVERIALIKGVKKQNANFSFICHDLSDLSDFAKPISKTVYKLMRKCLPGPFTFILDANNNVPKLFQSKKKTIGIRVPDNNVPRQIVEYLGHPIMSTSIHDDDEIVEYLAKNIYHNVRIAFLQDYLLYKKHHHRDLFHILHRNLGKLLYPYNFILIINL